MGKGPEFPCSQVHCPCPQVCPGRLDARRPAPPSDERHLGLGFAGATELVRQDSQGAADLVFLDVQMPELDGLGVIDAVGPTTMPFTIFVTAYDKHAVQAFEANALDYLLKPYSDERQDAAMARAKRRLSERSVHEFGQRMLRMASQAPERQRRLDRLVVKSGGTTRFIRVVDIDYIEAAGVYVSLHVAGEACCIGPRCTISSSGSTRCASSACIDQLSPTSRASCSSKPGRTASSTSSSRMDRAPVSAGRTGRILKSGWASHCRPRLSLFPEYVRHHLANAIPIPAAVWRSDRFEMHEGRGRRPRGCQRRAAPRSLAGRPSDRWR